MVFPRFFEANIGDALNWDRSDFPVITHTDRTVRRDAILLYRQKSYFNNLRIHQCSVYEKESKETWFSSSYSSDAFHASLHFSHDLDINLCPDKYTVAKM